MRHSPAVAALAVALVAGAGFVALSRGTGSATAAPQAGQFGVVDIPDLIINSPAKRGIDAANKKRQEAFQAWDADQQRKLKDLAAKFDLLPKADLEGRMKATHEFLLAKAQYDAESKFMLQKAETEMGDDLEALYAGVKAAATRVAKQYGYTAVFTKTSEPLRIGGSKLSPGQEFDAQVAARPVLYWDPSLDITELVKAELLKAAPGSPPPSPPVAPPSAPAMEPK
jgi:Skp family chaperone for outer membrane proteins